MNITKIIPIIAVAALLTACGKINTGCQTPSGQKFENSVDMIKKIAEQERAMGNTDFVCQDIKS